VIYSLVKVVSITVPYAEIRQLIRKTAMSKKERRERPEWAWEQALIDAYYDYRWRQVLDPLYEQMQQWKAGVLDHSEIDEAIHKTHKENQELYKLFTQRRDFLVGIIQMDREWFAAWLADHPPPAEIELLPPMGG
jgi:hypothetical protein